MLSPNKPYKPIKRSEKVTVYLSQARKSVLEDIAQKQAKSVSALLHDIVTAYIADKAKQND